MIIFKTCLGCKKKRMWEEKYLANWSSQRKVLRNKVSFKRFQTKYGSAPLLKCFFILIVNIFFRYTSHSLPSSAKQIPKQRGQ